METKHQLEWCEHTTGQYVPQTIWRRFDNSKDRFYFAKIDEKIEISIGITTAISKVTGDNTILQKWKDSTPDWKTVLKDSSAYGTFLHIAFANLLIHGEVPPDAVFEAEAKWDKSVQFQKDIYALIKFIDDYKVKAIFIEGILAQNFIDRLGNSNYISTTIDLFCTMTVQDKTKEEVLVGEYVRGEKKGQPKYETQSTIVENEIFAIVDLKSNYADKNEKSFFDSHRDQLIFGRRCLINEFGIDNVRMFNLSPLGYISEPKYKLHEWVDKENAYGVTNEDLLNQRLNLGVLAGNLSLKGTVFRGGELKLGKQDFKLLSYTEVAEEILNEL